MKLFTSFICL